MADLMGSDLRSRSVMAVSHEWREFKTFDEFLDEFERYGDEYFTKNIILVNRLAIDEYDGGDIRVYWLGTPSTDVIIKIYTPDLVIMDSYINIAPGPVYSDIWNGLVLTEEQFERFDRIFKKALNHYYRNRQEFRRARSEAFMNLIVGTKGKVIDALEEALGEDKAALVVAKELGVLEGDGRE